MTKPTTAKGPCPRRLLAPRAPRLVLLLALLALGSGGLAPDPAQAQSAQRKFGRGLAAMTTGFLEIPGHMVKRGEERGGAWVVLGFVEGLGAVVVRELVGVYEFLTAPWPVPEGYRPIMQPEYPWEHFE